MQLLVVDDNLADRELIAEAVAEFDAGIHLRLASSAAEAERVAAEDPHLDLAVVDLYLGRDSGRELIRRLPVPSVIMSTTDDAVERELALMAGAQAFWVKPLHFDGYRDLLMQARLLVTRQP